MSTLVGREDALSATNRFLHASPPDPRVLVLEGEAGIGKTAVWLDTVGAAVAEGHLVLDARPAASDAQLAYAGVTDLVGSEFAELRQALPAPQAGAVSAALLLEDHAGAVELRAVAMGFVSILAELARARQVLVAIDDIQWLDPASELRRLTSCKRRGRLHRRSRWAADTPSPSPTKRRHEYWRPSGRAQGAGVAKVYAQTQR
jgi:hypothetical protein